MVRVLHIMLKRFSILMLDVKNSLPGGRIPEKLDGTHFSKPSPFL